jgi:hypothetical protein
MSAIVEYAGRAVLVITLGLNRLPFLSIKTHCILLSNSNNHKAARRSADKSIGAFVLCSNTPPSHSPDGRTAEDEIPQRALYLTITPHAKKLLHQISQLHARQSLRPHLVHALDDVFPAALHHLGRMSIQQSSIQQLLHGGVRLYTHLAVLRQGFPRILAMERDLFPEDGQREQPRRRDGMVALARDGGAKRLERRVAPACATEGLVAELCGFSRGDAVEGVGELIVRVCANRRRRVGVVVVKGHRGAEALDQTEVSR